MTNGIFLRFPSFSLSFVLSVFLSVHDVHIRPLVSFLSTFARFVVLRANCVWFALEIGGRRSQQRRSNYIRSPHSKEFDELRLKLLETETRRSRVGNGDVDEHGDPDLLARRQSSFVPPARLVETRVVRSTTTTTPSSTGMTTTSTSSFPAALRTTVNDGDDHPVHAIGCVRADDDDDAERAGSVLVHSLRDELLMDEKGTVISFSASFRGGRAGQGAFCEAPCPCRLAWVLACMKSSSFVSFCICFAAFCLLAFSFRKLFWLFFLSLLLPFLTLLVS